MKKPVKIVLGFVLGLVLLVAVAVTLAFVFIDSIAKRGIEAGGTQALGVTTTLDSASVGMLSGKFAMSGLTVDNPAGFEGDFLKLGKGEVEASLSTLRSDVIVLPLLALRDVKLDLQRTATGSNYQVILDNLKKLQSGQKPPSPDEPKKLFKINEVSITNVMVHVDLLGGPANLTALDVPIAEVRMLNVGSDGSGVDLSQLTSIILEGLLTAAVEKGGGLIPADIASDLQARLSQLEGLSQVGLEAVGKAGEQVTKIRGEVEKTAEDINKAAKDAAKDLRKDLDALNPLKRGGR